MPEPLLRILLPMTIQCAQPLATPAIRVKQAVIHQCLFLFPLVCVVLGLKALEISLGIPGTSGTPGTADASLYAYFKGVRHVYPIITEVMQIVSAYTSHALLAGYLVVIFLACRRAQHLKARFLLSSIVIYYTLLSIVLYVFKIGFGVPRPYTDSITSNPLSFSSDFHSFPSGHTAECAAITSALAHINASYLKTLLLGCIMASVGFSRVYVGMHHPLDLLGGALLGSLAPLLASYLMHREFWHKLPFARHFTSKSLVK